jgi:hypothetical protein
MKPLQVYVDEADLGRLTAWSKKHRMTKSQAIRAAIRAMTRPPEDDALLALSGSVEDRLPPDCSARFDDYLKETFVAETPAVYSRRRPRSRKSPRR